jgi:DNA repair protein RecN (Recombination protein N)
MLSQIHIRDFAIVDAVDIELGDGMTTLTGETGAGKSILLDAIGLCLGDRADTGALPEHADRAEIQIAFDITANQPARDWLAEQALDGDDNECLLRRVVQRKGRSQAWINGRPAPLNLLSELGQYLIDIHGQHEHYRLTQPEAQRAILDAFGDHEDALAAVREGEAKLREIREAIARLEGNQGDYEQRLELLRFQVNELAALEMSREDIENLEAEQRRLASAGETIQACQTALAALYDDEQSAQGVLGGVTRDLSERTDVDDAIAQAHELFNEAQVQIQEGCNHLRHFVDSVDVDPARLQWVEDRLGELTDLARKHRVRIEELPERLAQLRSELAELESSEERLTELREEWHTAHQRYQEVARALSKARQQTGETLAERVTELIGELGMSGGALRINVTHNPDGRPTPQGLDQIGFEVRTNPDQRFGSLAKVASGGELSRIGLALEVATADVSQIPTLIFDEADAGIGGAVAEVVGRKLRELGAQHQVLCVTHLPQVAAQGHNQLKVTKAHDQGRTHTGIEDLGDGDRTEEIARMLGGVEITESTLQHAREMLQRAG